MRPLQAQAKAEPGTTPGPTSVWITTSTMISGRRLHHIVRFINRPDYVNETGEKHRFLYPQILTLYTQIYRDQKEIRQEIFDPWS